jgi:hypothetical protein
VFVLHQMYAGLLMKLLAGLVLAAVQMLVVTVVFISQQCAKTCANMAVIMQSVSHHQVLTPDILVYIRMVSAVVAVSCVKLQSIC